MVKDEIIEIMTKKNDKWMNIAQTITHDAVLHSNHKPEKRPRLKKISLDYYPLYLAFTHKKITTLSLSSCGSGLEKKPEHCIDEDYKVRLEARFGNPEEGNVIYEECNCPVKGKEKRHPFKSLESILDRACDEMLKKGLRQYSEKKGESVTTKIPFSKFSTEEPVQYFEKDREKISDRHIKKLSKIVSYVASKIDSLDFVKKCEITAYFCKEERRLVTSEGTNIIDIHPFLSIGLDVDIRHKDGGESTFEDSLYYSNSLSKLPSFDEIRKKTKENCAHLKKLERAPAQESGIYVVIMDSEAAGTTFHESPTAHLLSGRYVFREQTTTFGPEKLDKQILIKNITIVDNPTKKGWYGSYKYDEEGVPAQKVVLIESGILRNYLTDRTTAPFMKKYRKENKSNGHSRAEGVSKPEPRQSNLEVICSGRRMSLKTLKRKLINYCKKNNQEYGLIVIGGGGEVNVEAHGDESKDEEEMGGYEGTLKMKPTKLYRVYTDGREELVSRADIITEAYAALKSIRAVGGPYRKSCGICGADSGDVPMQARAPWIFLEGISLRQISEKGTTTERLDKIKK